MRNEAILHIAKAPNSYVLISVPNSNNVYLTGTGNRRHLHHISQTVLDNNQRKEEADQEEQEVKEDPDQKTFSYVIQLKRSFAVTMSLKTVAELGVFDIIAKARAWCQALASGDRSAASNQQPQGAGGSNNFQRLYSLGPLSKYFVTSEDGVSFCAMMSLLQDKVFMESWKNYPNIDVPRYELKNAILEGGVAFNRAHGARAFEYPRLESRFNKLFNEAMFNQSTILIKNILEF
ncbi:hypothetical protein TIFTF001_030917 [Ficus carica]|uniref:O-methyltransferase C-terminal domain-containing protein n=1 Tax=Ficus carica TaxID=3494 RepID=A0AA88J0C5_FICCA|nr:hypothetical protein TIFTF001_030917 [Ficus carica]